MARKQSNDIHVSNAPGGGWKAQRVGATEGLAQPFRDHDGVSTGYGVRSHDGRLNYWVPCTQVGGDR